MRLRAQILIDIDADDFADAAEHQKKVEAVFKNVRDEYGQAQLEFRQRRERVQRPIAAPGRPQHFTGRMVEYDE